jgi:hypothetical protein
MGGDADARRAQRSGTDRPGSAYEKVPAMNPDDFVHGFPPDFATIPIMQILQL